MGERDPKEPVVAELQYVNKQISFLMQRRNQNGTLGQDYWESLNGFHYRKTILSLSLLQLRHDGVSDGIGLVLFGREEDRLHFRSRNNLLFVIDQGSSFRSPYRSQTVLYNLGKAFKGNVVELMGQPDRFEAESPEQYVMRTLFEIRSVRKVMEKSRINYTGENELSALCLDLTKRVFRQRAQGEVPQREFIARFTSSDNIECVYIGPRTFVFDIAAADYEKDVELQRLIADSGINIQNNNVTN